MASMAEKTGLVLLGAALGSGAVIGVSKFSKSGDSEATPKTEVVKKGYKEIDSNNYWVLVEGESQYLSANFGDNLAQFRNEVPGDFIVIPREANYPLSNVALAIRKTQVNANGQSNTIEFVTSSSRK